MKYIARGLVYGKYWGGGEGSYPMTRITADTKEEILKIANDKLKDGSLDSGMGYEQLLGAIINLEEIDTIIVNEKEYSRSEWSTEFIGKLTESQRLFLEDSL